tara:strand:- start:211 stop:1011 length:801 start_codon:yes stop_codon:yes gene_type:complete
MYKNNGNGQFSTTATYRKILNYYHRGDGEIYNYFGDGHFYFSFWDVDGDGDVDFVGGAKESGPQKRLIYFENEGYSDSQGYHIKLTDRTKKENNPFFGIGYAHGAPAAMDVDNDGDLDLIIGHQSSAEAKKEGGELVNTYTCGGHFLYFENTGSATNPIYTKVDGSINPFLNLIHQYANNGGRKGTSLTFVDLDGDGDKDAVVAGQSSGGHFGVRYYTNTNNPTTPQYENVAPSRNWFAHIHQEMKDDNRQDNSLGRGFSFNRHGK